MILSQIEDNNKKTYPASPSCFKKSYDVIVCGMGTSGSLAALFLSEKGFSVLGVESLTSAGGTHAVGGVLDHYFGCPGGKFEAVDKEIKDFSDNYTSTQAESRKFILEKKLSENSVDISYEASVCGVYLEGKKVVGIKILTDYGEESYEAKVILDCTGDGAVFYIAGCQSEYGRVSDKQMQPFSIVSLMYNGKKYKYNNADFGRVNQMCQADLSRALLFSRTFFNAEATSDLEFIAQVPMIGVREGRRIISEENVNLKDVFEDKQTKTPAYYAYADLDKHGWDIAFDSELLGDWAIGANLGSYNVSIAISYKSILPKGFDGILVPCRALGVDRDISSAVRMNPDMKKLAELAAVWAELKIKTNKELINVPYEEIKAELEKSGCLKESDNRGYRIDGHHDWDFAPLEKRAVKWISEPDLLKEGLKTEKPGEAIWSAKLMGERAVPALLESLKSLNENESKHSAFALALLGNSLGNEVLRNMVKSRDGLMLKDCRKNNKIRGCMAIYWLGRLADEKITDELISLITDANEIKKDVYHQKNVITTHYKVTDFEDIYYQFISQAVMALVRIGDKHISLREKIKSAFEKAFSTDDYYNRITTRPKESSEGNMILALKNISYSAAEKW